MAPLDPQTWYTGPRFRLPAILGLALVGVLAASIGILRADNDFLWHRHIGERFLTGNLYQERNLHYLPARALWDSACVWLPYRVDRAIYTALALISLFGTLLLWNRLASRQEPVGPRTFFAASVFTLAALASYLARDLSDCGLQVLLLFFLSAAVFCLSRQRSFWCGFWLALAVAYKSTPILFLPYLCWKRQWQAAAWMTVFLFGWFLAPAAVLGWQGNLDAHRSWWNFTRACLAVQDPSENGVEEPTPRNQALPFAVARFVQTYPPGHPLFIENGWFVQFGDLGPVAAKRVVQAVLLTLVSFLAWQFRRPIRGVEQDFLVREWAVLIGLTALLSPLCWIQHLVLLLPAVFLWIRWVLVSASRGLVPRWHYGLAGLAFVIMLALHKDTLGGSVFMLLLSYKVHTFACMMVLAVIVLSLKHPAHREVKR